MEFGRKRNGQLRYLTEPELARFMAVAGRKPKYDALFSLMLSFGLRSSEAAGIALSDIAEDKTIYIHAKKRGFDRQYDLSDELVKKIRLWLRVRHAQNSRWLFPHYRSAERHATNFFVLAAYGAVAKAAGVEGRSPHSLRHSCGVNLARAGFTGPQISRHLRHRSLASSWHYCQIVEDKQMDQKALSLFDTYLAKEK